jgi:hypothetical protein
MNTSIKELQNLLNQVANIVKKYDDLALQSGEKFNVFDIIGLRNDEVRMHSAMLANLLDAQGSHGMKGKFLELFIKTIEDKIFLDKKNDFKNPFNDLSVTNCISELYAGPKTEDEGGRIDLYIYDNNNNALIIENKIKAPEQYKQLIRYNNFNDKAPILFLTLNGDKPSSSIDEITKKDISKSVYCISYKTDVLKWLESCHKEASDKPLIREGIKHYINLIKILTNQTMDNYKDNEMRKLVNENVFTINDILKTYNLLGENNFHYTLSFFIKLYNFIGIPHFEGKFKLDNDLGQKYVSQTIFKNEEFEYQFYFDSKLNDLYFYIIGVNNFSNEFVAEFNKLLNVNIKSKFDKRYNHYILEYKVDAYYNDKYWENLLEENKIKEFAFKISELLKLSR